MKAFSFILLAVIFPSQLSLAQETQAWPQAQKLSKQWRIEGAAVTDANTAAIAYIRALNGPPVYKVECHNGNYDDQSEMNFSGDFQCALFAIKDGSLTSGNLLASNTKNELSTDWWNRGRMRSEQLRGECLRYPEYSTERHFKLRGMLLTLHFTDVKWNPQRDRNNDLLLNGFTFTLTVVPDKSANNSKAGSVDGPEAPKSCYP